MDGIHVNTELVQLAERWRDRELEISSDKTICFYF
jgi:hypothetical protein